MSASLPDKKITTQSSNSGPSPPFIKSWKNVPKPNPKRSTVCWLLRPRNCHMLTTSSRQLFPSWSENQNHRSIWSTRDSAPTLNVNDDLRSSRRRTRFGKLLRILTKFRCSRLECLIIGSINNRLLSTISLEVELHVVCWNIPSSFRYMCRKYKKESYS